MRNRPNLNSSLDSKTFFSYYYLKEELVQFCRDNGLSVSGSKTELTERIAYFLDTGKKLAANKQQKKTVLIGSLEKETVIEPNIVCSEKHRAFFKEQIGSNFTLE